jgi:hypothetical protein
MVYSLRRRSAVEDLHRTPAAASTPLLLLSSLNLVGPVSFFFAFDHSLLTTIVNIELLCLLLSSSSSTMYLSTALALASTAGLASAHPFRRLSSRGDVASFPAGQSWDILLAKGDSIGNLKSAVDDSFQVLDIDLFDTDKQTIADLKSTKQVICYFSAGSKEGWRPDAKDFKDGDTGKELDGWPDEVWVNVKSENVKNIMKKRIQKAKDAGCSAIDPDNVDGFVSIVPPHRIPLLTRRY